MKNEYLTLASLFVLSWLGISVGSFPEHAETSGLLSIISRDNVHSRTKRVTCDPPRVLDVRSWDCEPRCEIFIQWPPPIITCTITLVTGCFCDLGWLLDEDDTCVTLLECGCYFENAYHPTGDVWTSDDCTQSHTCLATPAHTVQPDALTGCDATTEVCQLVAGDYACVCLPGYLETPAGSGICEIDPSIQCPPLDTILNGRVDTPDGVGFLAVGTYSCDSGFELRWDRTRECQADSTWDGSTPACWVIELIECGVSDNCDVNAHCTDGAGTFFCTCKAGYTGTGVACESLQDCDHPGTTPCSRDAYCRDMPSGIACICKPGYTGTGYICTDIVECGQTDTCGEKMDCQDVMGTYECVCPRGFRRVGNKCSDVEECGFASYLCDRHAVCVDCGGSYECRCKEGYYGNGYLCSRQEDYGQYGYARIVHSDQKQKPQHGPRLSITNNIGL